MAGALVVAPHPDDEVLGCSSMIRGTSATVVHVTDGVPPWTSAEARQQLATRRRAEAQEAWSALSARVDLLRLGFGDLQAWQSVRDVARSLAAAISAVDPAIVVLPAYQRGHPDHDATYLAAALARDALGGDGGRRRWLVYGLYGFDLGRRLRFGWLPSDIYGPTEVRGAGDEALAAKADALRRFTSQVWPGSALDLWQRAPAAEPYARLPDDWASLPDLPCYYDEALDFGRYGASAVAVEAAFAPVTAGARSTGCDSRQR